VLALFLLALVLRVGFVLMEKPGFYFEDSIDYDRAARSLLDSGHFHHKYYRLPLYPAFMAASYAVFGDGITPFRLVQALLGTGTCVFVWLAARRVFGPRTGLLALAGSALFPVHIILSGIEYPVLAGTFFTWLVLWLLVERHSSSSRSVIGLLAIGAGVGVSSLLFEGGFVLGMFVLLWILVQPVAMGARLRDLLVLGIAGGVLLGPWVGNMLRSGDLRPLILKAGIHLPTAPGENPPVFSGSGENLLGSKLSGLARNPGWSIRHALGEFVHFWDPYPDRLVSADAVFRQQLNQQDARMEVANEMVGTSARLLYAVGYSLLLFSAAVGGLSAWRRVDGAGILIGWPLVLGLCYAPFFTQMRYRIPADPAFIILGAYAVESAMEKTLLSHVVSFFKALWEGWKKIAEKLMIFWTFVLLLLLFVLVVGPIALLMRVFRKDPMHAPMAPGSFWALRDRTREGMEECLRQF